jgi:hypothetical protein
MYCVACLAYGNRRGSSGPVDTECGKSSGILRYTFRARDPAWQPLSCGPSFVALLAAVAGSARMDPVSVAGRRRSQPFDCAVPCAEAGLVRFADASIMIDKNQLRPFLP